jgi:dCMP deaminase
MNVPRGQRYELCRSVHSEANAIISASRDKMIGATLYLVGVDKNTGELVCDASPCTMCKRLIINAGISKVIIRTGPDVFRKVDIIDWIFKDDSLDSQFEDY